MIRDRFIEKIPEEFNEVVGDNIISKNFKTMNKVDVKDVTFLTLALADFAGATTYLVAHDFAVAGGLFAAGIVLVYLYHKFGTA